MSGQEEGPQDILVSRHGAHVLHLVLNRPAVRNALRNQSLQEIVQVLAQAESDDSVRAVVISGNDKAFAAGADLNEMIQKDAIATQRDVRAQYWRAIARFPKPLLAAGGEVGPAPLRARALRAPADLRLHLDVGGRRRLERGDGDLQIRRAVDADAARR